MTPCRRVNLMYSRKMATSYTSLAAYTKFAQNCKIQWAMHDKSLFIFLEEKTNSKTQFTLRMKFRTRVQFEDDFMSDLRMHDTLTIFDAAVTAS